VCNEIYSLVRLRDTLVPWIFLSDGTHLSNFTGDKKEWHVYMSIGKVSSKIYYMPSIHSVVVIDPLPIPNQYPNSHRKQLEEHWEIN
jgi:hypothetical protein